MTELASSARAERSDATPARAEPETTTARAEAPARAEIVHRRGRRFSLAWIWPLLALAAAGWLGWRAMQEQGHTITIEFAAGSGIEPGDPLTYRDLEVGLVRDVRLSESLDSVLVEAELKPDAEPLAREGTRFWVVRPDVSLRRVRGLDTIIGPKYIRVEPGPLTREGDDRLQDHFVGLDSAPETDQALAGSLRLTLRADRLGPLAEGSPVQYRDITVGHVRSWTLAPDATGVDLVITIEPPYRDLVRTNTRFWNASGIGMDWGWFRGLEVRAGSLESLVGGVIAFATPDRPGATVSNGAAFELAAEPDSDWLRWKPQIAIGSP